MKVKIFSISVFVIFILILIGLLIVRHKYLYEDKLTDKSKTVYIETTNQGFKLIRNGIPFYINGAAGDSYFKELAEIGGNTIRLYDTINLINNLDTAAKYGLAVVVDIPIPRYYAQCYKNKQERKILISKVYNLVKNYKNHDALLLWNLGNEVYPRISSWKDFLKASLREIQFLLTFNDLINHIKKEDKNHPVSTSIDYISMKQYAFYKIFSPKIDLLGYNNFGDIKSINEKIKKTSHSLIEFPYYISEFGSDGWWGNESKYTSWNSPIEQTSINKVEQIGKRYNLIQNNNVNCLGSLLFFWGNKYECTYTWFSFFEDKYKSEILLEVQKLWSEFNCQPDFIGLDYMLVDGKGALDNIIFAPNELKVSELKFDNIDDDSLKIRWEICNDAWFNGWNEEKYNKKVLAPPKPIDCFLSIENDKATFITPKEEGPYRIFAYVYDKRGYCATTNTPFYVLNP